MVSKTLEMSHDLSSSPGRHFQKNVLLTWTKIQFEASSRDNQSQSAGIRIALHVVGEIEKGELKGGKDVSTCF
jgi:hypothetical protein